MTDCDGCANTVTCSRCGTARRRGTNCRPCNLASQKRYRDRLKENYVPPAEDFEQKCSDCDLSLPKENFSVNRSRPSGLNSVCKSCAVDRTARYNRENREKYIAYQREYYRRKRRNSQ